MKLKSKQNAFCQKEVQRKWLGILFIILCGRTKHSIKKRNKLQKENRILLSSTIIKCQLIFVMSSLNDAKENILLRTAALYLKFQKRHLIDMAKVQAVLAPSYYS